MILYDNKTKKFVSVYRDTRTIGNLMQLVYVTKDKTKTYSCTGGDSFDIVSEDDAVDVLNQLFIFYNNHKTIFK